MRGPSPLYIEERHRALGRDATFSWSRALTHPPRCNRTRHRGRHLDFVGAAILDRTSWGPPSWTGSDVKNAKPAPILLPQTTPKRLKLPPNPNHYPIYSRYQIMRDYLGHSWPFRVVGALGLVLALCKNTVSHFSYAPLFQGPHFLTKTLESNILYENLYIDILSVW